MNADPLAHRLTVAVADAAHAHHARDGAAADTIYTRGIDGGDGDTPEFA